MDDNEWLKDGKCHWFALCTRDAVGTLEHALIGEPVPVCAECARRMGYTKEVKRYGA